jgi:hypothetical protein
VQEASNTSVAARYTTRTPDPIITRYSNLNDKPQRPAGVSPGEPACMKDALHQLLDTVTPGSFIGLVGLDGAAAAAIETLLAQAARHSLNPEILRQPLARADAYQRELAIRQWSEARRQGRTLFLYSHDEALLERVCGEVWWLVGQGRLERGAPRETLSRYREAIGRKLAAEPLTASQELLPTFRRGDGRAELLAIEPFGAGQNQGWITGEPAGVRVTVCFAAAIDQPVVGVLIRTRIGLDVFGTNTAIESLALGPAQPGTTLTVEFRFTCLLAPGEYTITAASHDADGVWHDWMDEAILMHVAGAHRRAGVLAIPMEVRRIT